MSRDPIQRHTDAAEERYDVTAWEARSLLDRGSVLVYRLLHASARLLIVALAVLILLAQGTLATVVSTDTPLVAVLVALSVLPALALVVYVYRLDPTTREQAGPMVVTFLLAVLFAGFAAVVNSLLQPLSDLVPVVGLALYFYLVVGPVEETVKWLAVRLWAYGDDRFDAVVDGAVYGAIAGLGFATIENVLYIARGYLAAAQAGGGVLERAVQTTTARSLAGPGHVIYSGFAGYYLGLAKFNPGNAGPIVVKGLLIATLVHGTYNTAVSYATAVVELTLPLFVGFILVYDGVFGYLLYRKIRRYRETYEASGARAARE